MSHPIQIHNFSINSKLDGQRENAQSFTTLSVNIV